MVGSFMLVEKAMFPMGKMEIFSGAPLSCSEERGRFSTFDRWLQPGLPLLPHRLQRHRIYQGRSAYIGAVRNVGNPIWVWVKMRPPGERRCWSMFSFTGVPIWVRTFDPRPFVMEVLKFKTPETVCYNSYNPVQKLASARFGHR